MENVGKEQDDQVAVTERSAQRPHLWIRLLALIFVLLSGLGWIRFEQTLAHWGLLLEFGARPGPLYIAAGGILWGLAGLPPAFGLMTRRGWGPPLARWVAPVYPLSYWADRFLFSSAQGGMQNWVFALVITALWLVYVQLALPGSLRRIDYDRRRLQNENVLPGKVYPMMDSELEVKFYLVDLPALETRLRELGANQSSLRTYELNLRFDTQEGSLSRTRRVLRLRQDAKRA